MNAPRGSGCEAAASSRTIDGARIRAAAASGLCDTLRGFGAEPGGILRRIALSEEQLRAPAAWLPLSSYCQLFEQVAVELAMPTFGLTFGLERWSAILGDLRPLATSAPTMQAAFQALARALPAHQEQSTLSIAHHGGFCHIAYRIFDEHVRHRRQDAELTLGVLIGFVRSQLGAAWAPIEVHLEHRCDDPARRYDQLLGAPVSFGRGRSGLVMRQRDAAAVLPGAEAAMHSLAESRLRDRLLQSRADDFVGVVLDEMREAMADGAPSIKAVAGRLGLSGPALYRRLKTCGVEFSVLRRDLRRHIALMHLNETTVPLTEVALLLGYSELSAFSRAFRSWTGLAAIDYRRQRGGRQSDDATLSPSSRGLQ